MANIKLITTIAALAFTALPFSIGHAASPLQAAKYASGETSGAHLIKVHDDYGRRHDDHDRFNRKTVDQVKLKLKKRGYKKIKTLDNVSPTYKFKACRDGDKFHLYIRDDGKLRHKERIGYCKSRYQPPRDEYDNYDRKHRHDHRYKNDYDRRDRGYDDDHYAVTPAQVRRILRRRGYNRISFSDRYLPLYKVNACKNDIRYKVYVGGNGVIRRNIRIGYCSTGSRYRDYWRSPRKFRN